MKVNKKEQSIMKNYKISDLFLVNKDENVSKLNDEIKFFCSSLNKNKCCNKRF